MEGNYDQQWNNQQKYYDKGDIYCPTLQHLTFFYQIHALHQYLHV